MSKKTKRRMTNSSESSESDVEDHKKKRKISESEESTAPTASSDKEDEEESEAESIPKEKITLKIKKDRIQPPQDEDESSNDNASSKNEDSNSDIFENDDDGIATKSKHIRPTEENGVSEESVESVGEKVNGTKDDKDEDKENSEKQKNGQKTDDEAVVTAKEEEPKKPMIRLVPLTSLLKAPITKQISDDVLCLSSGSDDVQISNSSKKKTPTKKKEVKYDSSSEDEIIMPVKKRTAKVMKITSEETVKERKVVKKTPTKPVDAMTNDEILSTFFTQKCKVRIRKDNLKNLANKQIEKKKKDEVRRNKPGTSKAKVSFLIFFLKCKWRTIGTKLSNLTS